MRFVWGPFICLSACLSCLSWLLGCLVAQGQCWTSSSSTLLRSVLFVLFILFLSQTCPAPALHLTQGSSQQPFASFLCLLACLYPSIHPSYRETASFVVLCSSLLSRLSALSALSLLTLLSVSLVCPPLLNHAPPTLSAPLLAPSAPFSARGC